MLVSKSVLAATLLSLTLFTRGSPILIKNIDANHCVDSPTLCPAAKLLIFLNGALNPIPRVSSLLFSSDVYALSCSKNENVLVRAIPLSPLVDHSAKRICIPIFSASVILVRPAAWVRRVLSDLLMIICQTILLLYITFQSGCH